MIYLGPYNECAILNFGKTTKIPNLWYLKILYAKFERNSLNNSRDFIKSRVKKINTGKLKDHIFTSYKRTTKHNSNETIRYKSSIGQKKNHYIGYKVMPEQI